MSEKIEGPSLDDHLFINISGIPLEGNSDYFLAESEMNSKILAFTSWWFKKIAFDSKLHQEVLSRFTEITELAAADQRVDEDRAPFHDEPTPNKYVVKPKVVEIGEWLNEKGGLGLMQFAYYNLSYRPEFKYSDARSLESAWNGIGEWRS